MRHILNYCFIGLFVYSFICLFPYSTHAQSPGIVDPFTIGKRVFTEPPNIAIAVPEDKSTIFGSTVTLRFIADNIILTNPDRKKVNEKGEGHILFWVDTPERTEENAITHYLLTDYILKDVPPGTHTVTAELVQNNGKSFAPPATQTITFTTLAAPTEQETSTPEHTISSTPSMSRETMGRLLASTIAIALIITGGILYKMK